MCEKVMCDDGIEREIVSRKEAKEQGLVGYFTGKPCKHGHVAERYASSGMCCECVRQKHLRTYKRKTEVVEVPDYVEDDEGVLRKVVTVQEALDQGLKRYFTGIPCQEGHISERTTVSRCCIQCRREKNRTVYKENHKEYYRKNKEQINKKNKKYYEENFEKIQEQKRKHHEENPHIRKEYREKNKQRLNEYANEYQKRRYREDLNFKMKCSCRSMLWRVLKETGEGKEGRTNESLGYSNEELMNHLESRFLEGMSWDNFREEWHIDHIRPISKMIQEGIEDPSIINNLKNLCPMWKEHNLEKGDKEIGEYLEERPDLLPLYGYLLEK